MYTRCIQDDKKECIMSKQKVNTMIRLSSEQVDILDSLIVQDGYINSRVNALKVIFDVFKANRYVTKINLPIDQKITPSIQIDTKNVTTDTKNVYKKNREEVVKEYKEVLDVMRGKSLRWG